VAVGSRIPHHGSRIPTEFILVDLPPDQPPPRLRRSAEALRAKAEGGSHIDLQCDKRACGVPTADLCSVCLL